MADPAYANGHPLGSKRALAEWMRYPSVEAMDADHDALHADLSLLLGITSQSLRLAAGETLTSDEQDVAACEEAAVLHVQRWLQWAKVLS
jgi:hypothetical protein